MRAKRCAGRSLDVSLDRNFFIQLGLSVYAFARRPKEDEINSTLSDSERGIMFVHRMSFMCRINSVRCTMCTLCRGLTRPTNRSSNSAGYHWCVSVGHR